MRPLQARAQRRPPTHPATHDRSHGGEYWYFFCRGTQNGTCDAPFSHVDHIEAAIEDHYKTVELSKEFVQTVRNTIERAVRDEANAEHIRHSQLQDRLSAIQAKEDNLLDLAADGALPQDRIRQRLREIGTEREKLREQLAVTTADLAAGKRHIEVFLDLLTDVRELNVASSDQIRRELN